MVPHAIGNMLGYIDLLVDGRSEFQATATLQPLIWDTGVDSAFLMSWRTTLVIGAATVWAYRRLAILTVGRRKADMSAVHGEPCA